jgi:hypothetical protein
MDDEFFFPQNVTTTYRIFGLGPRHLRRAAIGLGPALLLAMALARWTSFFSALLVAAVLLLLYVAAFAYPTFGDETLMDIVLHQRAKTRTQTAYQYAEEVPDAEP